MICICPGDRSGHKCGPEPRWALGERISESLGGRPSPPPHIWVSLSPWVIMYGGSSFRMIYRCPGDGSGHKCGPEPRWALGERISESLGARPSPPHPLGRVSHFPFLFFLFFFLQTLFCGQDEISLSQSPLQCSQTVSWPFGPCSMVIMPLL